MMLECFKGTVWVFNRKDWLKWQANNLCVLKKLRYVAPYVVRRSDIVQKLSSEKITVWNDGLEQKISGNVMTSYT